MSNFTIDKTQLANGNDDELRAAMSEIVAELNRREQVAAALVQAARMGASAAIAEKLQQINALYMDCQRIADENNITFSFTSPGGGGWYDSDGWQNSSSNC